MCLPCSGLVFKQFDFNLFRATRINVGHLKTQSDAVHKSKFVLIFLVSIVHSFQWVTITEFQVAGVER